MAQCIDLSRVFLELTLAESLSLASRNCLGQRFNGINFFSAYTYKPLKGLMYKSFWEVSSLQQLTLFSQSKKYTKYV